MASREPASGDDRREIDPEKPTAPTPGRVAPSKTWGCEARVDAPHKPHDSLGSQDGTCFRQPEGFAWTLAAAREGPGSMNYAYEIRRQAEAAPRAALPAVASALWKAFGEGHLSEAEAEALSGLIEARQVAHASPQDRRVNATGTVRNELISASQLSSDHPLGAPRSRAGSRPRTDASMERRRRWAASGRLPPGIAARFTLAEQAVLAVVAVEVTKRGRCALAIGVVAALAGVSETSVRRALREARTIGLITVDERRLSRFRSDTNLVAIIDQGWSAWLRLARRSTGPGGGCQIRQGTNTSVPYPVNSGGWKRQKGCRVAEIARRASGLSKCLKAGRAANAMP